MNEAPRISVIVPVYNVEKYLERCLDSVFAQTLDSFEVICVDDGSTDASPEILSRYAQAHANMRVIRKENGGLSSARNAGLDVATGEYVWFVDSDDRLIGSDALERMRARAAEAQADLLIFGGDVEYESEAVMRAQPGYKHYLHRSGRYPDGLSGQELYIRLVEGGDYVASACLQMFRREFLRTNRLRFIEGLVNEDQLFTLQCFSLAKRAAQLTGDYYLYYVREGSIMTGSNLRTRIRCNYQIAAMLEDFDSERLRDASAAFRKCYFDRVHLLAQKATSYLFTLPLREWPALIASLDSHARRIAFANIALAPWRALRKLPGRIRRKVRRALK